jgi:hypothetical protein
MENRPRQIDARPKRRGCMKRGLPPCGEKPLREPLVRECAFWAAGEACTLSDRRLGAQPRWSAADSDEVAWAFRDDVARDYEMISLGFGASLA